MLKRLQKRIIGVAMGFMVIVLFATLASTYVTTNNNLDRLVVNSLNRVLNTETPTRPYIGVLSVPNVDETVYGQRAVVWVDISDATGQMDVNESAAIIGPRALDAVLEAAEADPDVEMGEIPEYDVIWKRGPIPGGERIAIANAAATRAMLTTQLYWSIGEGALFLIGIAFVVWRLATWMMRPVRLSWEAQQRFTADASHELKTPLAVIIADTQILEGDLDAFPEEQRRWVESTAAEARRMQVLVNNLLELSKADAATISTDKIYRQDDIDLSKLVDEACLEFEVMAFEAGCLLDYDVAEGIHVTGDGTAIDRVVRILLDNAVKYATKGTTVKVTFGSDRSGSCRFAVNNHGETLDPSDVEHIFDRFYRSDNSRSRSTGGFGLGLAIAQATVVAAGGNITCTSTDEAGTTFAVTLPVRKRS